MKSQGLPMNVIAIIIILVVALAVFVIFFFNVFEKGEAGTDQQHKFAECQAICADISSKGYPTTLAVESSPEAGNFCNLNCDNYISCRIRTPGGTCTITCGHPTSCS